MQADVLTRAREAYGLGDVSVTPGARGALGQVWRVAGGEMVLALKHVFTGTPPLPALISAEVAFTRSAAAAGVRLPLSHADLTGRHVVPLPDGGWLRLHDWVDLRPADLSARAEELGVLVARLHSCAPPLHEELEGGPPDRWYGEAPDPASWAVLVTEAADADRSWAARLAVAVDGVPALTSLVTPAAPATMRLCHRDLHPGNVLADDAGELVVVDWDGLGPAALSHELAATLVYAFHDGETELAALRRCHAAYVDAGGPARLDSPGDFTMLVATHLNFLRKQVRIALDPTALDRDRQWAETEIDESLRVMPTPGLVEAVLEAVGG